MAGNPNDVQIAVVPSVVPVGPWRASLVDQFFALHLAAARYRKPTGVTLADLLPWNWGVTDRDHLFILAQHDDGAGAPRTVRLRAELRAELATPNLDTAQVTLADVKEWVTKDIEDGAQHLLDWDLNDAQQGNGREARLAERLIYMSTFPGDVPQHLALVHYFRLTTATLNPDGTTGTALADLSGVTSFVVAPVIAADGNNAPEFAFPADSYWFYGNATSGKVRAALVKPTQVKSAGGSLVFTDDGNVPPARLDFKTLWVSGAEPKRPWTDALEQRCEEVYDAFNRLSDAAPNPPETPDKPAIPDWDRIRLKSLAFNAQWEQPSTDAQNQTNATDRLISALFKLLGESATETQLQVQAGAEVQLRARLAQLHRELTAPQYPLFVAADLVAPTALVSTLKTPTDKVSTYLRGKLSPATVALMDAFTTPPPSQGLIDALVAELNQRLDDQGLYTPDRFDAFTLAPETRELIAQELQGDALRRLNRALLEDAYTGRLAKSPLKLWRSLLSRGLQASDGARDIFAKVLGQRELLGLLTLVQWSQALGDAVPGWDAAARNEKYRLRLEHLFLEFSQRQRQRRCDQLLARVFADSDVSTAEIVAEVTKDLDALCVSVSALPLPNLSTTNVCAPASGEWKEYVKDYAANLAQQIAPDLSDAEKTEAKPGGLTLQLDDVVPDAGAAPDADADIWRKLAGVGLAIRGEDSQWRMTSAANIVTLSEKSLFRQPALVPVRVPFRNGVRYPFINYNQRSLAARSPLAYGLDGPFKLDPETPGLPDPGTTKYKYDPVTQEPTDPAEAAAVGRLKLTRLRFGKEYEAAAFMIDTAGGLPAELSRSANGVKIPWQFDERNWTVPAGAAKKFTVRRKVPVGQVRVGPVETTAGGTARPAGWREIPRNVSPLARELESENWITFTGGAQNPSTESVEATPLTLLYGPLSAPAASLTLSLRPPTVDVDVLERWLEKSDEPHLKEVLKDYYSRLVRRQGDASANGDRSADPAQDISIDDPAVPALLVTAETYNFEERRWDFKSRRQLTLPTTGDGISRHQSRQAQTCKLINGGDVRFDAGGTLLLPADTINVVRVSVHALVAAPAPKFPGDFFESQKVTPAGGDVAGHICLRPFSLLLETPTEEMPTPLELWDGLSVRLTRTAPVISDPTPANAPPTATVPPAWVEVRLVPRARGASDEAKAQRRKFRNVVSCDVLRQTWRWQGRPVRNDREWLGGSPSFPDWEEGAKEGATAQVQKEQVKKARELLEWEVEAFAEMDDLFDTLSVPLSYPLRFADDDGSPLHVDKFDKDARAYYIRYGVRAHSRYRGLFASLAHPVVGKHHVNLNGTGGGAAALKSYSLSGVGWRRAFVPYRGEKPPKPVVRAIVPLSRAYHEGTEFDKVSPLMVTLDETMFGFCGITEAIECEVERVTLPPGETFDDGTGTRRQLFQAGPDPILDIKTYHNKLNADAGSLTLRCDEPFGHTFDTDARQPLFNSTSLILRPDPSFRPWDFARIRFRRVSRGAAQTGTTTQGEWTTPLWVQFLPSSTFGLDNEDGQHITLTSQQGRLVLTFPVRANPQVDPNPQLHPSAPRLPWSSNGQTLTFFKYWLLFTEAVTDFRGKRDREQYLADVQVEPVAAADGSVTLSFNPPAAAAGRDNIRCRLLEVQVPPGGQIGDLWKALFDLRPGAENSPDYLDATARITRVSPYFPLPT